MNKLRDRENGAKEQPLTERTRRRIFALLHERGLDDDVRHQMQNTVVGKESLTDFTESEGWQLLNYLNWITNPPHPSDMSVRRKYSRPDGVIEIYAIPTITEPQIRKLYALMHEIADLEFELGGGKQRSGAAQNRPYDTARIRSRLDGWSRKITSHGSLPPEAGGLSELMKEEASNLIEILKDRVELLRKKLAESKGRTVP